MCFAYKEQLISNGETEELKKKRKLLLTILSDVLKAIEPFNAVRSHIKNSTLYVQNKTFDTSQFNNFYVIAFGKGSVGMAQAICDQLPVTKGIVITNDPKGLVQHPQVETIVGGHPLPNEQSIAGAKKAHQLLMRCEPDDLVVILISGGGSALLASPRISLSDLQLTTKLLLASGATIQEINTIRKHLSTVKGGQLIKSLPCQVVSLIVSDVVGDPFEFIASGPTVGDTTTFTDACSILIRYKLWDKVPNATRKVIEQGKNGILPETPFPDDPVFKHVTNQIIANNSLACETAFTQAKKLGFKPIILSTQVTGEARKFGPELFEKAMRLKKHQNADIFISGGEPTVTLKGKGKGGRNQEMVLSVAKELDEKNAVFCSFGTDGIDGMSPAAGAIADGFTLKRAKQNDLDIDYYLDNNDSFTFFNKLDDALITGPTGTNVMDIQILIF
jgi:glycerate-2-kinase